MGFPAPDLLWRCLVCWGFQGALKRGMDWFNKPRPRGPIKWTELLAIAVITPPFVAWLIGPSVVKHYWARDAKERVDRLGYQWAGINVQEIPCRKWTEFDFGYSVDYRFTPNENLKRGYLCRRIGDKDWTWHP